MTINITEPVAQWLLDYGVKQLRRERRAYERRIAQAESLKQKLYRLDFNTKPLTLSNDDYMVMVSLLAGDIHEQGKVVGWIDARLKELKKSSQ